MYKSTIKQKSYRSVAQLILILCFFLFCYKAKTKRAYLSVPEFNSLTRVDIAFVTESAATSKSFLSDLPTEPGVPFPLLPK